MTTDWTEDAETQELGKLLNVVEQNELDLRIEFVRGVWQVAVWDGARPAARGQDHELVDALLSCVEALENNGHWETGEEL